MPAESGEAYMNDAIENPTLARQAQALLPYCRRHWRPILPSFAGIIFTSALHALTVFIFPLLNRSIFDSLIPTLDHTLLARAAVAILALVFFSASFKFILDAQTAYLRTKMMGVLRLEALQSIYRCDYARSRRLERGATVQKLIGEVDAVASGITSLCQTGSGLLQLAIIVVVLTAINGTLFWLALLISGCYGVFAFSFRKTAAGIGSESGKAVGKQYTLIYEAISSIKAIKSDNLQGYHFRRFASLRRALGKLKMKRSLFDAQERSGQIVPARLAFVFLMVFGFMKMKSGEYGIGMFATLFWFTDIVLDASVRLRGSFGALVNASVSAFRLSDLLDEAKEPDSGMELSEIVDSLEFDSVCFAHEPGRNILENVSLSIPIGARIGIAGASGAGKSTLIDLLAGLIRADRGRITADGNDLDGFSLASRRKRIGFVSQDVFLFNDTIRNNIDLSGVHGKAEISEFCRLACLEGLLERLPDGLDSMVGEAGMKLSGGERQRVSLARCLASGARVLVLDEATSALDPLTESRLIRNLNGLTPLQGPLTLLLIAHRRAVIAETDHIYVLENGRIVESGIFEELIGKRARLFELMNHGGGIA